MPLWLANSDYRGSRDNWLFGGVSVCCSNLKLSAYINHCFWVWNSVGFMGGGWGSLLTKEWRVCICTKIYDLIKWKFIWIVNEYPAIWMEQWTISCVCTGCLIIKVALIRLLIPLQLVDYCLFCSAGIGRTGVLMTMETAMCLIECNQPVYPLDIVRTMRDQRAMMIQTPVSTDYLFFTCHHTCLHWGIKFSKWDQMAL